MTERDSDLNVSGTNNRYWCFISYRHSDNHEQDRNWASWLHQEIERYDVPVELVGDKNQHGELIPERIYPVFRDEESLPAGADMAGSIASALDRSRSLVVLCSPRAVESQYVAQEIHHFKQTGKKNGIIAAILDGEPSNQAKECYPEPLRHPVCDDGTLDTSVTEVPRIAADFRVKERQSAREGFTSSEAYRAWLNSNRNLSKREVKKRAEAYDYQLQLMKLKIIAGILGVEPEKLHDRDKAYQLQLAKKRARTLKLWLTAVIILALVASIFGYYSDLHRKQVQSELARADRSEAIRLIAEDQSTKALAFLAASLRRDPHDYLTTVRTVTLLSERTFAIPLSVKDSETGAQRSDNTMEAEVLTETRGVTLRVFSPTGKRKETRLTVPFENPWGTHWRSGFDDRGNWLAILATNRTGTDAKIWGLSNSLEPQPAIETIRMAEETGDRMFLIAVPEPNSVPNSRLTKLRIQIAEDPKRNTLWDVADGRYGPVWVGYQTLEKINFEKLTGYSKVADILSKRGWKLEESGDESPFKLLNSEGKEFPLDHAAYTNTYSIDVSSGGGIIATGGEDKEARIWHVMDRSVRPGSTMVHPETVGLVRLSNDGKLLLTATGGPVDLEQPPKLRLWDTATGELLAGPWPTIGRVTDCFLSKNNSEVRCVVNTEETDKPYKLATWPIAGANSEAEVLALADLVEAVGGWSLTNERALVSLPLNDRLATIEHCRASTQNGRENMLRKFINWFLADRDVRHSQFEIPDGS